MGLYAATFLAFHSDSQVSILTTPRFRLYSGPAGNQRLCATRQIIEVLTFE